MMQKPVAKCAMPSMMRRSARDEAISARDEAIDDFDGAATDEDLDESCLRSACISNFNESKSSASVMKRKNPSAIRGHPRIEHLHAAAAVCSNISIDASGLTVVKMPENFDGAALVMLSSDSSCEWQIVHACSSQLESPSSLLQRQLCLTQPFAPDTHMSLQVSLHLILKCTLSHLKRAFSLRRVFFCPEKNCRFLTISAVFTPGQS
jgi:hypothetical protein